MSVSKSNRLVWTTKNPSIPGYYFYLDPEDGITIGEVYETVFTKENNRTSLFFNNGFIDIEIPDELNNTSLKIKWAGPIDMPIEE